MSDASNGSPNLVSIVAIVALAVGCFASGWALGRTTTLDMQQGLQLAALEAQVDALEGGDPGPRPTAAAARPAVAAPNPADVKVVDLNGAPIRGPEDATITLVEFSDFQCPFCSRVNPTLAQVREEYGDKVKIAFKHFPLSFHAKAVDAHKASIAAGNQGKFWEMHDLIFANPKQLDPTQLRGHAETLGLDLAKYDADLSDPETQKLIDADQKQGASLGVRGTPSFFINGVFLSGAQPFSAFKQKIDQALTAEG